MDNHVEHFYQTGKLLNGTYYFDPPLIEPEIRELHSLFRHIRGNKVILNPLSDDLRYTGNYNRNRTLLWLDVSNNTITGWQNVDIVEDEGGEYVLNNLRSIQKWCQNGDCNMPFRDGRLFLAELPNTEDIFNQLNEQDEFDWVDISTDSLSGQRLYDVIQDYFNTYRNDRYWLEQHDGFIELWGDSGGNLGTYIYFEFTMSQFTIDILIQALKTALLEVEDDEVRYDYIHLAKTLEPIIGSLDIFNQLNESDDFDWVDTSTDNLSGQRLYDLLQNFFYNYCDGIYWLEKSEEDGFVEIWDHTGIYYDFKLEEFTIDNLIQSFKNSILNKLGNQDVKEDYIQLAKTLEPILGPAIKTILNLI